MTTRLNKLLAEIRGASRITVKPKRHRPGFYTGSASTMIDGVPETVGFQIWDSMSAYGGGRQRREWIATVFKKSDPSERDFLEMDPVGSYREVLAVLKSSLEQGWKTYPGLGLCSAPSKHDP